MPNTPTITNIIKYAGEVGSALSKIAAGKSTIESLFGGGDDSPGELMVDQLAEIEAELASIKDAVESMNLTQQWTPIQTQLNVIQAGTSSCWSTIKTYDKATKKVNPHAGTGTPQVLVDWVDQSDGGGPLQRLADYFVLQDTPDGTTVAPSFASILSLPTGAGDSLVALWEQIRSNAVQAGASAPLPSLRYTTQLDALNVLCNMLLKLLVPAVGAYYAIRSQYVANGGTQAPPALDLGSNGFGRYWQNLMTAMEGRQPFKGKQPYIADGVNSYGPTLCPADGNAFDLQPDAYNTAHFCLSTFEAPENGFLNCLALRGYNFAIGGTPNGAVPPSTRPGVYLAGWWSTIGPNMTFSESGPTPVPSLRQGTENCRQGTYSTECWEEGFYAHYTNEGAAPPPSDLLNLDPSNNELLVVVGFALAQIDGNRVGIKLKFGRLTIDESGAGTVDQVTDWIPGTASGTNYLRIVPHDGKSLCTSSIGRMTQSDQTPVVDSAGVVTNAMVVRDVSLVAPRVEMASSFHLLRCLQPEAVTASFAS